LKPTPPAWILPFIFSQFCTLAYAFLACSQYNNQKSKILFAKSLRLYFINVSLLFLAASDDVATLPEIAFIKTAFITSQAAKDLR
jgi:hypothetical protein